MAAKEDVYCTLVWTDSYLPGAAVLAHSLRDAGTTKKFACLIVQDALRPSTITELQSLYNYVIPIERISNPYPANLYLMNRPDLLHTFSKINLWRLTQFRKIVYLDSDIVALRAPDELFDIEESFAAAPDVGWPDAFNTGMMVLAPHQGDYHALKTLASTGDSFDGADQGLLNQYFEHKPWKRLSFTYNCTPSGHYQYEPAYRYYKRDISLVHYIGPEKPWVRGRAAQDSPSSYQELLGRWWAVYDRHFHISTHDYIATGERVHKAQIVQQEVRDVSAHQAPAYYASGYPVESTGPAPQPFRAPALQSEAPLSDPAEKSEAISQGHVEPTSTAEQRRFTAPQMEWDATRAAPPSESRPEAINFPVAIYEFNTDPQPFKPPPAYPEPPKDMWYEVPKEKPKPKQKLDPIFPWEEREVVQPTRTFIEDDLNSTSPSSEEEMSIPGMDEFEVTAEDTPEPVTPVITTNKVDPWQDFGVVNKNAWDEVQGIESYVRALTAFHKTRGKVQVVPRKTPQSAAPATTASTPGLKDLDIVEQVQQRRESLVLTDFPTAIERPSLPVTPAPRRRGTLWGTDANFDADLPEAQGVPDQVDWDPSAQLEELRRNSVLGPQDLKLSEKRELPRRHLPGTSLPQQDEVDRAISIGPDQPLFTATASSAGDGEAISRAINLAAAASDESEAQSARAPVSTASTSMFREPNFGGDGDSNNLETSARTGSDDNNAAVDVVSPSEKVPA